MVPKRKRDSHDDDDDGDDSASGFTTMSGVRRTDGQR